MKKIFAICMSLLFINNVYAGLDHAEWVIDSGKFLIAHADSIKLDEEEYSDLLKIMDEPEILSNPLAIDTALKFLDDLIITMFGESKASPKSIYKRSKRNKQIRILEDDLSNKIKSINSRVKKLFSRGELPQEWDLLVGNGKLDLQCMALTLIDNTELFNDVLNEIDEELKEEELNNELNNALDVHFPNQHSSDDHEKVEAARIRRRNTIIVGTGVAALAIVAAWKLFS